MNAAQKGHLAMLAFSALVAGSFALGAQVANEVSPLALNAVRFWIAALVIGLGVIVTGGMPRGAVQAPWRYLVLGGLFTTYFVLMFEGLKTATAVSASAVFTLTPILSGLFGWLLLRQVTTPRMALALALGAAGALWVIFRADLGAFLALQVGQGELIYFAGCVCHAIYTPMVRRLNRGESALVFTFGTLVAGAILLTIVGWESLRATDWGSLRPLVWLTIAYVAIFASASTFVLLQFASLRLPAAKVMAYTYLTPSWVLIWQGALGGAIPPLLVWLGLGFSLLALAILLKDEGG